MKIRFTDELKNFNDTVIVTKQEDKDVPITLRDAACIALTFNKAEEEMEGSEKLKRFLLAKKIFDNDVVDLQSEDIVLIKVLINKVFSLPIVAASYLLLEGK